MKTEPISIDVGIPTYLAGASIARTLASIDNLDSAHFIKNIFVVCDGTATDKVRTLKKFTSSDKRIQLITHTTQKGQSIRINEILRLSRADLLLLTNDDVILDNYALSQFIHTYLTQKADLLTARVKSISETHFLQKILVFSLGLTHHIITLWNGGVNYLACNGRLIALSKNFYSQLKIPAQVWNNDAYIYLFAKQNKFKVAYCKNAIVYFKLPTVFIEHVRQSLKFQFSYAENKNHFAADPVLEYKVPKQIYVAVLVDAFWRNPLLTVSYFGVNFLTRLFKYFIDFNPTYSSHWKTDLSTKQLI